MTQSKVWTKARLISMDHNEFQMLGICLRAKAYRLLGINWNNWIAWEEDPITGTIHVTWE